MKSQFYVLTGGPCSGKTTLLHRLEALGYPVVAEAATEVLRRDRDGTLRKDPLAFQKAILRCQLRREAESALQAPHAPVVFTDRGIGDHFGYLRYYGLEPFPELLDAWREAKRRYQSVFFLAENPEYRTADHRAEPVSEARKIHEILLHEYRTRHPRVIPVPWLSLEERATRVLAEIDPAGGTA